MSDLIESRIGIIPSDWTIQPLAQSTTKIQDGTHFSPKTTDGPCRYLTSKNVRWGRLDLSDCGRISQQEHDAIYARCDVKYGDVLLTKDGANTGNACLNTLHEPFSLLSSVAILRTDESAHSASFILQYFLSPDGQRRLKDLMSGNAITRLTLQKIKAFETPVPPTPEQRKIARILTTVDNLIEKTEALIAKYQAIKQGMMHDLFTRGVDEHGHLRPPYEQAPELYKQSELGWIPKEWEVKSTLEVAARSQGSTTIGPFGSNLVASDYRTEGVPVVFVRDVKADRFEWSSNVYVDIHKFQQLNAHTVRSGDILSTKMGLPPCISCIYPHSMTDGVITADIIRLRPDSREVDARWLVKALNTDAVQRQVQAITAGVTRPKVTLADFRGLLLSCPPLNEQRLIADRVEHLSLIIETECERLEKTTVTKTGLMQDLLTGKVRVKVDEAKEVAVDA